LHTAHNHIWIFQAPEKMRQKGLQAGKEGTERERNTRSQTVRYNTLMLVSQSSHGRRVQGAQVVL